MIPPHARAVALSTFERALAGEPGEFDSLFVGADGETRGVRALYLPLRGEDAVVAVLMLAYAASVPDSPPPPGFERPVLTRRQREVLGMMAAGRSTEQMASDLTLSVETVRNHTRAVLHALGAHTRLEALAAARRFGLLSAAPFPPASDR